jgi:hypothetical protein
MARLQIDVLFRPQKTFQPPRSPFPASKLPPTPLLPPLPHTHPAKVDTTLICTTHHGHEVFFGVVISDRVDTALD